MAEQGRIEELINRIRELEKKIIKLEKESRMGLEDQLFFGVIIALVVFLLELRPDELALFFQDLMGVNSSSALSIADAIRTSGLLCLLSASATRYYGAVSGSRTEKRFRLLSLQLLIMAWNFSILIMLIVLSLSFETPFSLPVASVSLLIAFVLMLIAEKKVLNFYASRGFIFKKNVEPSVTRVFLLLTGGFYISFVVEIVAVITGIGFSSERFLVIWILPLLLAIIHSVLAGRRKKTKRKA